MNFNQSKLIWIWGENNIGWERVLNPDLTFVPLCLIAILNIFLFTMQTLFFQCFIVCVYSF